MYRLMYSGQTGIGEGFLQVLRFPPSIFIPSNAPYLLSSYHPRHIIPILTASYINKLKTENKKYVIDVCVYKGWATKTSPCTATFEDLLKVCDKIGLHW
jgi:hypothetical protein